MICSRYCDFNETLSSYSSKDSGLPRCIMGTVPPAILLFFVLLLSLIQLWKRKKIHAESYRHGLLSNVESLSVQEIVREEIKECELDNSFVSNPAEFIHGDNRTSFLYTFHQFLHICLVLVPVIDVITKVALVLKRLQGYTVVSDAGMFLTWMIALFVLRSESKQYFKARISRHSLGLLLFWTLAFIIENLAFISWNNPHWWFGRQTGIQEAEFGLFVARYTIMLLVFLLGLKGPGLYRPPKPQVPIKEEPTFVEGSSVRVFSSLPF